MQLCTFMAAGTDEPPRPGLVRGDQVVRLEADTLIEVLAAGLQVGNGPSFAMADVRLLAPIPEPPSIRDFFAFEEHVATARGRRGLEVPDFWYQEPVFYFANPAAVVGPDDVVAYPQGTEMLDYELEVAAVIGRDQQIVGFTIMNDWSARDLQRAETSVGLGPAKGKDFATSLGPILVTADEFDGTVATMVARVNGVERSNGQLATLYHPWATIRDRAALNTRLRPGDILGSGTVGTGCILELDSQSWLQPGDVVEMEVTGLGVLRNTVGVRDQAPGRP